jgi:hypothetical protein
LLETNFKEIAGFIALAIEAAAVFVVSYGALQALFGVIVSALSRNADAIQAARSGQSSPRGSRA